jgi:Rrf2 family protein
MTRIQKKVEYSLMALKLMSQQSKSQWMSAKEIAEKLGVPFEVVARVLQSLASEGVIDVQHGALGGYQLARDLKSVSFLQLINSVQGPVAVAQCLTDQTCVVEKTCNIQSPIRRLDEHLNAFFAGLALDDILETRTVRAGVRS